MDDYLVADDSIEGTSAMTAAVFSPTEWTAFEGFKNGVPLNVWELEDLLYGFLTPWDVSCSSLTDGFVRTMTLFVPLYEAVQQINQYAMFCVA
jgi:hypothetical protein